jgi:hypothetical protein
MGTNGEYGDATRDLCRKLKASGVILVVLDGSGGSGVEVAVDEGRGGLSILAPAMAKMLRSVAEKLETDAGRTFQA